jgi:hypothetical protein
VQADPPGHDGAQSEQRRQVEHVRAKHHAGADLMLAMDERGHRRGDLRGVCGQCRQQAKQRFGQAQPGAYTFQPHHEHHACAQAERCGRHEDRSRQRR